MTKRKGNARCIPFQSTPVIANGRIIVRSVFAALRVITFQSTPVIANGRISQIDSRMAGKGKVSIHARYC